MRIDVLTIFPEFFKNIFDYSILKRAQKAKKILLKIHDIRDYSSNKHKKIDDYQFGGGAGMVMKVEPIDKLISKLKAERIYDQIIYLCPEGELMNQRICNTISISKNIILLCGHYKGIDERIKDLHITQEISIGDYVLTGGEMPAAVLIDSVVRLIPGVINNETSALTDSFQDDLLAPPVYTRPSVYKKLLVPEVLLSGNQKLIEKWREDQSFKKTKRNRPDLLK